MIELGIKERTIRRELTHEIIYHYADDNVLREDITQLIEEKARVLENTVNAVVHTRETDLGWKLVVIRGCDASEYIIKRQLEELESEILTEVTKDEGYW